VHQKTFTYYADTTLKVVVYSFEYETPSQPFLVKKASYRTSTAPIDLSVDKNLIAIADLMKSVSIVEYEKGTAGRPDTLNEIARHFQTTWGTAVAQVDENLFLESDAENNLMVLEHNVKGLTADDRRRLQPTSEMCLGEMVNKIRRITVPTTPEAVVIPRAFLATVRALVCKWLRMEADVQTGGGIHLPLRTHRSRQAGSTHATSD